MPNTTDYTPNTVDGRVLGERLSLSVGTAIPIEERIAVEKLPINELWLHIDTLWRNYLGSYEDLSRATEGSLVKRFLEELSILTDLVSVYCRPVLYITNTDPNILAKRFPHAQVKFPVTDNQKMQYNLIQLMHRTIANSDIPVLKAEQKLPGKNAKAYIMTHHPMDLMSRYEFDRPLLLSSHTGKLLGPELWNTRLSNNKNYHKLPFNLLTLQVIGDRATLFKSGKPSVKKALLAIAEKGKWLPTTTNAKVSSDIKKYTDPATADLFLQMLRIKLK